eukprot:UN29748
MNKIGSPNKTPFKLTRKFSMNRIRKNISNPLCLAISVVLIIFFVFLVIHFFVSKIKNRETVEVIDYTVVSRPKVPRCKARIFIMRHGEKDYNSVHLSKVGAERAEFIANNYNEIFYPHIPNIIYATAAGKHSNREFETIEPLAKTLNIKIRNQYHNMEWPSMTKEINDNIQCGDNILICWHHGEIANIIDDLGVCINDWSADDFHTIFSFKFEFHKNKNWHMQSLSILNSGFVTPGETI